MVLFITTDTIPVYGGTIHVYGTIHRWWICVIPVGAMASEKDLYKIEKFNGTNFNFWKMQMEDYLYQKDLYLPLAEKS